MGTTQDTQYRTMRNIFPVQQTPNNIETCPFDECKHNIYFHNAEERIQHLRTTHGQLNSQV